MLKNVFQNSCYGILHKHKPSLFKWYYLQILYHLHFAKCEFKSNALKNKNSLQEEIRKKAQELGKMLPNLCVHDTWA